MAHEKRQFSAQISKVLQLMIHSLYTNKDIFLRELISNASDACDKLRYEALVKPELLKDNAELKIHIAIDKKNRTVTVADNGIGMNREELAANLGTIARSGTQEFLNQLTGDAKKDMPLIGQFGVGFYSSFMVAEKVTVASRKAGEEKAYAWESDGQGEFTIGDAPMGTPRGTQITLHLKPEETTYLEKFRLKHIISTYSDHISFPIVLTDEDGKTEAVNQGAALWTRAKSDITDEQYKEFYHHVAHSPDTPWMILHNKAEGKIEYTNLLFIPSVRPFDLFHPDRRRRVKLYVKRVFITEEGMDLIPHYLRFLRGIIDSEDLPLNISRETLQHNPVLDKIRESVVKRVLSELKKKAEKEPEAYAPFWKNFGAVLKEGLCEAQAPKEQILEVCRFQSTHAPEALTGLDEYIARMPEGQEFIYYLTGERLETVLASPQLEGFVKRGVEVLLLTDHVDDFWVSAVFEYKGKQFKAVAKAGKELDDISTKQDGEKPEEKALDNTQMAGLLEQLKKAYGNEVKEVRLSNKLTESPVCLAIGEMDMDIRLERFLLEQKQLPSKAAKILEVNAGHPIIQSLAAIAAAGNAEEEFTDAAFLLLDQARILEGEEIGDAKAFSRRLSGFLQRGLAA